MNYRPTLNFLVFITFIISCGILLGTLYATLTVLQNVNAARAVKPTPAPRQDWRPDIRHCHHPDVDLWGCIRKPGEYPPERREELRALMYRTDL